jgi:hypothetical protein
MNLPSLPTASALPSWLNATLKALSSPFGSDTRGRGRPRTSQMRTVPSSLPEARFAPSSVNATEETAPV